jgi:hypothetical protein
MWLDADAKGWGERAKEFACICITTPTLQRRTATVLCRGPAFTTAIAPFNPGGTLART